MSHPVYTRDLIQAISDWQRGGSQKQKQRRGKVLKDIALDIPDKHRSSQGKLYRQIALDSHFLRILGGRFHLKETVSAWSHTFDIAKNIKGGVPPQGGDYIGVIFSYTPMQGDIILDFDSLFKEKDFMSAVQENQDIYGFSDGLGRYKNTQREVVCDVPELPLESLVAWGGHSSSRESLIKRFFGTSELPNYLDNVTRSHYEEVLSDVGPQWRNARNSVGHLNGRLIHHALRLGMPDLEND